MTRMRAFARLIGVTTLTAGISLGFASSALADYPPTFTAAVTLMTDADANGFAVSVKSADVKKAAVKRNGDAKKVVTLPGVKRNVFVAPTITALPKNTDAQLKLSGKGFNVTLGTLKTGANGSVQFPALKFKKPGAYTFSAVLANGQTFKFRLVVS